MRSKDYRELQLSSSLLIFIFLGIIIVGIVIFLLGVSVGKKQTQLAENTQIPPDETLEQVTVSKPNSVQEPDPISKEIASHQEPPNKKPQPIEKKPSSPPPLLQKPTFQAHSITFRWELIPRKALLTI